MTDKYSIEQKKVENILNFIRNKEIAIPEIQRPFVWTGAQVRDLIDSLYNGYPTGYLIIWQNPNVRLKNGEISLGKKILIDGQQRVTAIMTAIDGIEVLRDDYTSRQIKIAFNPWAKAEEPSFEVQTPVHLKDKKWIPDISVIFKSNFNSREFEDSYIVNNPSVTPYEINAKIQALKEIVQRPIGVIMLDTNLDINEVTEIFVRINSQGKTLNEADFAMSKIAADVQYEGNNLRKAIDYFCHLVVEPTFWSQVSKDKPFMSTPFGKKMKWLADDNRTIYNPNYSDMLRVSLMHKFNRGKLKDLVSLLSGRNFENRTYEEKIRKDSFTKLKDGIMNFINEHSFKKFVQIIEAAGFISPKLLRSQITLDFAYTLFLMLHERGKEWNVPKMKIDHYVRRWFVLTTLTGRYSGSPESWMDRDLRGIEEKGIQQYLFDVETAQLGEAFWTAGLVQSLEKSVETNPTFCVYIAAQVFFNDRSLFTEVPISKLLDNGDVHHVFPKNYMKQNGYTSAKYNQLANYAHLDTTVNIEIGDKAPNVYFADAFEKCTMGESAYGTIKDLELLKENLLANCIPINITSMGIEEYEAKFLPARRKMMAEKIRKYYEQL